MTLKHPLFALFIGLIVAVGLLFLAGTALSSTNFRSAPQPAGIQGFSFFSATTTTATSTNTADGGQYLKIVGAKKVTMYFTHGGTATTSTTGSKFKVETTKDGVIWNQFDKLIGADLSSTATSTYTIQGATTTIPVALDLSDDTFYAIRCISVEIAGAAATDGEQTCEATVEF